MIVLKNKIIFFHIPKTAGKYIRKILSKYKITHSFWGHDLSRKIDKAHIHYSIAHEYIDKTILETYNKFCVVRNPYERLISAFNYRKVMINQYKDINTFCLQYIKNNTFDTINIYNVHFVPQYKFISNNNNKINVNYIIKYIF